MVNLADWARAGHSCDQGVSLVLGGVASCTGAEGGRLIIVSPGAVTGAGAAAGVRLYARVSSYGQKADLDRQVARGVVVGGAGGVAGGACGVCGRIGDEWGPCEVRRLLADPKVATVVVHRDRLDRMNAELVDAALSAHKRRLVVLDDGEVDDDLVGGHGGGADIVLRPSARPSLGAEPGVDGARVRVAGYRPENCHSPGARCRSWMSGSVWAPWGDGSGCAAVNFAAPDSPV